MTSEPPFDLASIPDPIADAVLELLERDERAREAALEALCAAHPAHAPALRAWVAAALAGHESLPAGHAVEPTAPGDLGPYRVVRLLGRGGFGAVWLAEQEQPVRRPVAIKVLRPGMDSHEILQRFAGEREALARMDHAGIARLLDVGLSGEDRPYFVMEYVDGVPLPQFCRQHRLDLTARLQLFARVAEAVHHAHQRGILHRDLSSNNVLVGGSASAPVAKIIDFGVARSIRAPLHDGTLTLPGTLLGTPEYLSPEQAAGLGDLDLRTDIYALGVQLYELLCDTLPIPSAMLRAAGPARLEQTIRGHPVLPPSANASTAWRQQLRGDLDAICLKMLAKERDERYASVAELLGDLQRHFAHEPVLAARPSTFYRLRKFIRRHRSQTVLAGLLAALLIAAIASIWAAMRAAERARDELADTKDELARRADAGFRLLANIERLRAAQELAPTLVPAEPSRIPAFLAFVRDCVEPLRTDLPAMRQKLAELQQRRDHGALVDPADEHLWRSLSRLVPEVELFLSPAGLAVEIGRRREWAEQLANRAAAAAPVWAAAQAAIKQNPAYRGLQLAVQPGIEPLATNPAGLWEFRDLRSGAVLVLLPAGSFWMGVHRGEPGLEQNDPHARDDELPIHNVQLDAFLLGKCELTRRQWQNLRDGDLQRGDQADSELPVTSVSQHEVRRLLAIHGFELPTEAQWEYACRAGTRTPWSFGAVADRLAEFAWCDGTLHPVGKLQPNAFGLHDLHGNAAEWCRDAFLPYDLTTRDAEGLRTEPGPTCAVRGGHTAQTGVSMRSAARAALAPGASDQLTGFRLQRRLQP